MADAGISAEAVLAASAAFRDWSAGPAPARYLGEYYQQRAEQRANHARKVTGNKEIRYAEAYQRILPNVVTDL